MYDRDRERAATNKAKKTMSIWWLYRSLFMRWMKWARFTCHQLHGVPSTYTENVYIFLYLLCVTTWSVKITKQAHHIEKLRSKHSTKSIVINWNKANRWYFKMVRQKKGGFWVSTLSRNKKKKEAWNAYIWRGE